ncbi:FKBP-type peptidyl-prolyl cis-trans isomerase SlyD [bacterium BMS3Bbin07]|nr:FKBP-type peptidyl-prolyl cis-trans isomerase SlyD [bacterium BMS3Bbin07]
MVQVKAGDTVRVHYSGFLDDGTVFDSSLEREPFEFTLGQGMVIPGFEDAVVGMDVGDSKTVNIPTDQAYGPYRDELLVAVERSQVPPNIEPDVGMELQIRTPEGTVTNVTITEMDENSITLDANHPLAGKDLIFEIKLVEIV